MPKVTQLVNSRAKICTQVSLAPNTKLFSSSCQTMASLSYISAIISSTVWLVSSKKLSSSRALRFGLGKGRNKSKLLGGDCSTIYKLSPEQASSIRLFLHFWSRELVVAKDRHSGTTCTAPSPFMKIDNNTHLLDCWGESNKMMALNVLYTPIRAVHFLMAHSGLSIL